MLFEGVIDYGIALLLALVLAHYAGLRKRTERGWTWLAVAGVFLIFGGFNTTLLIPALEVDISIIPTIFTVLGWIFALIGAVFVAYELLLGK
ncbi:MAG: hypothetical protein J7L39_04205 [Candidatus Aenigmarchaeota archaeon]|nr:hypothetical protein [Candidatus Aenigmarchaeota archaeon]